MNTIALTQVSAVRLFTSGFPAFFMTLVLFFLMKNLIDSNEGPVSLEPPSPPINWVKIKELDDLPDRITRIVRPVVPEVLPQPPETTFPLGDAVGLTPLITPPSPIDGIVGGLVDGPPMATVVLEPRYPHSALSRQLEGYAVVEFDISKNGQVVNARVLESAPGTIFNRSALDAIRKFRYKPKVVDGKPQVYSGAYYRFTYEMTKPS